MQNIPFLPVLKMYPKIEEYKKIKYWREVEENTRR